jgi:hypothetical protein
MIPARPTRLGRLFWTRFSRWSIRQSFTACDWVTPHPIDPSKSLLFLGNHISWWDGFWPIYLNEQHFHKEFYVMMLEEELKKRPFMAQGGAFSIQPSSRTSLGSLNYAAGLLAHPQNLVVMYPQGAIQSVYDVNWQFAPGVSRVIAPVQDQCQVMVSAVFSDYLNRPKPFLRFYTRLWDAELLLEKGRMNTEYAAFFESSRQHHLAWSRDQVRQR